jgi:hypothetical protein
MGFTAPDITARPTAEVTIAHESKTLVLDNSDGAEGSFEMPAAECTDDLTQLPVSVIVRNNEPPDTGSIDSVDLGLDLLQCPRN